MSDVEERGDATETSEEAAQARQTVSLLTDMDVIVRELAAGAEPASR
jgi:hypothetical protein